MRAEDDVEPADITTGSENVVVGGVIVRRVEGVTIVDVVGTRVVVLRVVVKVAVVVTVEAL